MARRRARIIPRRRGYARPTSPRGRGRPTSPRGPQGSPRARRNRRRAQAVKRPTSPRGPQGRKASGAVSSMQDLLRRQKETGGVIRGGPRGPQGPRGPMGGIQLAQRNAIQRQMEAAARSQAGRAGKGQAIQRPRPGGPQGPMRAQQDRNFAALQRPIPNRDGRMAQMQAYIDRANRANAAAAGRPPAISMDPRRGTFGRAFNPDRANPSRNLPPRPMPPSNYMRQPMPPQQMQRGMGRGPMPRANIGQIQAPRPTFGQQMRPIAPGQRLSRRRVTPRRR